MTEPRAVELRRPPDGSPQPTVPFPLIAPTTRERARAVLTQLAELTGFRVAALSVVRQGQGLIQLAELVGAELSDADKEQTWLPLTQWGTGDAVREHWGVWRFRHADSSLPHDAQFDWHVAPSRAEQTEEQTEQPHEDDWDPGHSLVCEVRDDAGDLRAALHLDAPIDGKIPAPEVRQRLNAVGEMAIQSIHSIMDSEQARQRAEIASATQLVAETTPEAPTAEELILSTRDALASTFGLDEIRCHWFHEAVTLSRPREVAPAPLRSQVIRNWRNETAHSVPPQTPGGSAILQLPVGDATTCYGVLILERRTTPAPWSPAEITGAVGIGRELGRRITELEVGRRLQLQVEDLRAEVANRAQIASAVAHDLASPLHAIRNYVELLDHPSVTSDEQRRTLLEALRSGTSQAAELAAQLTLLSRAPLAETAPTTDLAPLLHETLDLHTPTAEAKDQMLSAAILVPTLVSMANVDLRRVLANLTSNALKYTPPGGRVEVTVTHGAGEAIVAWRDTGIGIAPSQLPRIFEEFYRSPDSFTQAQPGTGLGLPIVKRLIENAHGTVEVTSTLGRGTTVEVRLPLAPDQPAVATVSHRVAG